MHALDVLGDGIRRRILEMLAGGEQSAGAVVEVIRGEFGVTQPAVSQHLKVLRESGFAHVRPEGTRRVYAIETAPLQDIDRWLETFRNAWAPSAPTPEPAPAVEAASPRVTSRRPRAEKPRLAPAPVQDALPLFPDFLAEPASKRGRGGD